MLFKLWIEALATGHTVAPPPNDKTFDDGDDGEKFWKPGMEKLVNNWLQNGNCVKSCIKLFSDHLLNIKNKYKPTSYKIYPEPKNRHGTIEIKWEMDFQGIEFNAFEKELKEILLRNCDLWKFVRIPYEKAYFALEDMEFLTNTEIVFFVSDQVSNYLYLQSKFASYEAIKNNKYDIELLKTIPNGKKLSARQTKSRYFPLWNNEEKIFVSVNTSYLVM